MRFWLAAGPLTVLLLGPSCGTSPTSQRPRSNLVPKYTVLPRYTDEFTDSTLVEGAFRPTGSVTVRDATTYHPGSGMAAPGAGPASPPFIGEIVYPTGYGAGYSPGEVWVSTSSNNWTHLYAALTVQLSSNFYGQSAGANKVLVANIHGNPCLVVEARGTGLGTLTWEFALQNLGIGASSINLTANVGDATVTRGAWQRVEIEVVANTPGVADGVARMWLTNYGSSGQIISGPTMVADYMNIGWASSAQSNTWGEVLWNPIWGGLAAQCRQRNTCGLTDSPWEGARWN